MMNLLKPYVDEDNVNYDEPSEDSDKQYLNVIDFPEDDHINGSNNESIKQPPRPIASPFVMLRFPPYLPGRRLLWVEQVEAFFCIAGIDTDEERFDYVVLHADSKFIAPYLDMVLRSPKKSQPRAWKDLKVYLAQNMPVEKVVAVKRTQGESNTPEVSDTPNKSDSPKKSDTPENCDSTKQSDTPEKSATPKKSDTPNVMQQVEEECHTE